MSNKLQLGPAFKNIRDFNEVFSNLQIDWIRAPSWSATGCPERSSDRNEGEFLIQQETKIQLNIGYNKVWYQCPIDKNISGL